MTPSEKKPSRKETWNLIGFFLFYKSILICHLFLLSSWVSFEYVFSTTFPTNTVLGQVFINPHQSYHNHWWGHSAPHRFPATQWPPAWTSTSECLISKLYSIYFKLNSQPISLSKAVSFYILSTYNDMVFQARDLGEWCAGTSSSMACESQLCTTLLTPTSVDHADGLKFGFLRKFIPQKFRSYLHFWFCSFLSGRQFTSPSLSGDIRHDNYLLFQFISNGSGL